MLFGIILFNKKYKIWASSQGADMKSCNLREQPCRVNNIWQVNKNIQYTKRSKDQFTKISIN